MPKHVRTLAARAEKLLPFLLYPHLLCDPDLLADAKTGFCKLRAHKNEDVYLKLRMKFYSVGLEYCIKKSLYLVK
jgi:hypothetical protein